MTPPLILPSKIPWAEVKGKELEELLYWLFDSMGAKEMEWRIGGTGCGSSDQGRDLELTFFVSSPDNEIVKQRWWVEAKGRSKTVEPADVKNAVLTASGKSDIDVLLIATNAHFSNATRDWVKEWQANYVRPKIKLWEKTELENYCSKHPLAVIRLFSKALSSQGKLEVCKARLWDYMHFTEEPILRELWKEKNHLTIDSQSLIGVISSEAANGDLALRSWGMIVDNKTLTEALISSLNNYIYFLYRASQGGTRYRPIVLTLAYLTLLCIKRYGEESTTALLTVAWECRDDTPIPDDARKFITSEILGILFTEFRDVCTSDCSRVHTKPILLSEKEIDNYWKRFDVCKAIEEDEEPVVSFESTTEPCKVGFAIGKGERCPLCEPSNPTSDVTAMFKVLERVLKFRTS